MVELWLSWGFDIYSQVYNQITEDSTITLSGHLYKLKNERNAYHLKWSLLDRGPVYKNVIMGFLVKNNISFSRPLFNVGDYYQPLHKTFLEFVAAYYLKSLVTNKQQSSWLVEEVLQSLEKIARESVEQVLLFTVEMLQDDAHVIFRELANIGFFGPANLR